MILQVVVLFPCNPCQPHISYYSARKAREKLNGQKDLKVEASASKALQYLLKSSVRLNWEVACLSGRVTLSCLSSFLLASHVAVQLYLCTGEESAQEQRMPFMGGFVQTVRQGATCAVSHSLPVHRVHLKLKLKKKKVLKCWVLSGEFLPVLISHIVSSSSRKCQAVWDVFVSTVDIFSQLDGI